MSGRSRINASANDRRQELLGNSALNTTTFMHHLAHLPEIPVRIVGISGTSVLRLLNFC
jgi:hypothetical protein